MSEMSGAGFMPPLSPPERAPERELTTTRRNFLKGMLGVSGLLVFDSWRAIDEHQDEVAHHDTHTPLKPNAWQGPVVSVDDQLKDHQALSDTVEDALVATGAVFAYSVATNNKYARLYSGNSGDKQILEAYRRNKLKTTIATVVTAPVVEESLFRGLPAVFGRRQGLMAVRGIFSTYAFGKVHQLTRQPALRLTKPTAQKLVLNQNKVPVPQYALGAFYWMVARRRGLLHSMVAHATTNSVVIGLLELGSRAEDPAQKRPMR